MGIDLCESIKRHQVLSRANLEVAEGKKYFEDAISNEENFDMEWIMCALDAYNRAGKLAFEVDTELEAITEGLIGKVWYRALKNPVKARPHLYNSIRLSELLKPKVVTDEKWFVLASK